MKKALKIITVSLLCLAVFSLLLFTAFAEEEEEYTGTVAELNALVDAVASAAEGEKPSAFDAVNGYLPTVFPGEEGYTEAVGRINVLRLEYAESLLEKVNVAEGTAKGGAALARVYAFLNQNPIEEGTEGYTEFAEAYSAKQTAQEEAVAAHFEEFSKKVPYEEYALDIVMNHDFTGNGKGTVGPVLNGFNQNKDAVSWGKDGDNRYWEVVYNQKGHSYVLMSAMAAEEGLIFEFDFTMFDFAPADQKIYVEHQSCYPDGTTKVSPRYLTISGDGTVEINGAGAAGRLEGYVVEGGWTRFTLVLSSTSPNFDVYVNYQHVGTGKSASMANVPNDIRIGAASMDAGRGFAFDNLYAYKGTVIRDDGRYDNMDKGDAFLYLVDYMCDESRAFEGRNNAYLDATKILPNLWSDDGTEEGAFLTDREDVKAGVAKYLAFDYDAVLRNIKRENLIGLQKIIEKIEKKTATLANMEERAALLAEAEEYLDKKQGMIADAVIEEGTGAQVGKSFADCSAVISALRNDIEGDRLINSFINIVGRFDKAISIKSKQKYYDSIRNYLNGGVDGFNLLKLNTPGYEDLKTAYERTKTMEVEIGEVVRKDNGEKIVKCMGFIAEYDSESEWIENYDYVEKYVLIVRELVYEGNYDDTVEGVKTALQAFEPVNAYFYAQLQKEHVAYISGMLDKFRGASSYISKLGYCSLVTVYLEQNDIDEENTEIIALLRTHQAYLDELEVQKEDYGEVLRANTVYFINLMELVGSRTGYAELKELFDSATEYYYAMNVGSEEAAHAIEVYTQLGKLLAEAEQATKDFATEVALLDASQDREALFAQLAVCCQLRDGVTEEIEGADEVIAAYNAVYEAYTGGVTAANGAVAKTQTATLSLRAGYVPSDFLGILEGELE